MSRKSHTLQKRRNLVVLIAIMAVYVAYALLRPLGPLTAHSTFYVRHDPSGVPLAWPNYGEKAIGALGYGVLATNGDQKPLATASVIKILTALAVLRLKPLHGGESGPNITITADDVASYNKYASNNGSVAMVALNESISEKQALEAMLLPSANNFAETVARWAFGSLDEYQKYANEFARQLGMVNTTVTGPSGFDNDTISTPSDLVVMGEAALANPVLAAIIAEPSATIPVQGTIYNVNNLLGIAGLIGIKTGNNDVDPGCFLFASRATVGKQQATIVGVIMGAPSLQNALQDTVPLLDSVKNGFVAVPVASKDDRIASYRTAWGATAYSGVSSDVNIVAWDDSLVTAELQSQAIPINASNGSIVGHLLIKDTKQTATQSVPVVITHSAEAPSILWRLTHVI